MKYYVVKNGRIPGIYESWEECKEQVDGYSNREFKSFKNLGDAKIYYLGEKNFNKTNILEAYVDGSFYSKTNTCGYGLIILKDNEEIEDSGSTTKYFIHRNVTGEVIAASKAMEYALNNGYKDIRIYYDYEGIRSWALGKWKTNKELTIRYKKYFDEKIKDKVKVDFVKVKAHSGNEYNDKVDLLAKKACGVI